jgi:hypothetical protein
MSAAAHQIIAANPQRAADGRHSPSPDAPESRTGRFFTLFSRLQWREQFRQSDVAAPLRIAAKIPLPAALVDRGASGVAGPAGIRKPAALPSSPNRCRVPPTTSACVEPAARVDLRNRRDAAGPGKHNASANALKGLPTRPSC